MLGEHSQEILTELGYDAAAIDELVSTGVTKLATAAQAKMTAANSHNRQADRFLPMPLPRSFLYVPANREKFLDKALGLPSDAFIFDLEDSVPTAEKANARAGVKAYAPKVARPARLGAGQRPGDRPGRGRSRRGDRRAGASPACSCPRSKRARRSCAGTA